MKKYTIPDKCIQYLLILLGIILPIYGWSQASNIEVDDISVGKLKLGNNLEVAYELWGIPDSVNEYQEIAFDFEVVKNVYYKKKLFYFY